MTINVNPVPDFSDANINKQKSSPKRNWKFVPNNADRTIKEHETINNPNPSKKNKLGNWIMGNHRKKEIKKLVC